MNAFTIKISGSALECDTLVVSHLIHGKALIFEMIV